MKRRAFGAAVVALGLVVALASCGGSAESQKADAPEATEEATETVVEDTTAEDEAAAKAEAEAAAKAAAEAEAAAAAQALEEEHATARAGAEAEGLSVFTGTVHVMTGEELCAYEDKPINLFGEDAASDSTYIILEFDETTHVVGERADGSPGEGDADHMGIGRYIPAFDFVEDSASFWLDYDGARVCVAGNPWFQTDVSLPFAPRMYDARLLYVE